MHEAERITKFVFGERYEVIEDVISQITEELKQPGGLTKETRETGLAVLKKSSIMYSKRKTGTEFAFDVAEMCFKGCVKGSNPFKSFLASIPRSDMLKVVQTMKEFMPMDCIEYTHIYTYI